jgi:small-conductance mechanosensitive channel
MGDFWDDIVIALDWVPTWIVGLVLVALAIVAALSVHRLLVWMIRRTIGAKPSLWLIILKRTREPSRLAFCLAAVALVMPLAPLNAPLRSGLTQAMVVACIALIGWIAVRTVDMAAGRYLQRFRVDVEDNLLARKHVTQVRVLKRVMDTLIVIVTVSTALMTFDSVRQYGVSLFASAGAAGLVLGLAARPVLGNLIAGVQIAITQPIRIEDAVIVENEWGWVEEIASTYVVVRLWDWRRLVVPLTYFIEKPFQNWTRETASLIGSVILHVDYAADVARIRSRLTSILSESKLWDGAVVNLQVVDTNSRTVELRALVSARNASAAWDLRCEVREKLLAFLQTDLPEALPRDRADIWLPSRTARPIPEHTGGPNGGSRTETGRRDRVVEKTTPSAE